MRISLKIAYETLESQILEKLKTNPIEVLGKNIAILGLKIRCKKKNQLEISVKTDFKILSDFTVLVQPNLYHKDQEILLEDIHITLNKTNFIGKSLMMGDEIIIKYITNKINPIIISTLIPPIIQLVNEEIKKIETEKKIKIALDQKDIIIESLDIIDEYLGIDIRNNMAVEVML